MILRNHPLQPKQQQTKSEVINTRGNQYTTAIEKVIAGFFFSLQDQSLHRLVSSQDAYHSPVYQSVELVSAVGITGDEVTSTCMCARMRATHTHTHTPDLLKVSRVQIPLSQGTVKLCSSHVRPRTSRRDGDQCLCQSWHLYRLSHACRWQSEEGYDALHPLE